MYKNEQIKREFFEHLRGAEGFSESSVGAFAEAIGQWQQFTNNEDFSFFNKAKAGEFRQWLSQRGTKTKSGILSIVTQYNYLRRVKRFFTWLSEHADYRSKVLKQDVNYLRLSKKDALIARSGTTKATPTFEEAKKIIETIEVRNEVDMRDRAMICFALITGCRIFAIVSLRMKNFVKEKKLIHQNPGDGVKTKNSKTILTTFFPIDWDAPEQYFVEWYEHLEQKGFRGDDPIFPATVGEFGVAKNAYNKDLVGNAFWSGTSSARKIFEKRCKNADLPYFHPHSFRHLVVSILSKTRLTEEEKRAISMNLGHENVGTTFGAYGYGSMNSEKAVEIILKLKYLNKEGSPITDEEKLILERILAKLGGIL